jgi:cell division protein FtsL
MEKLARAETEMHRTAQETPRRRFVYNGDAAPPTDRQNEFAPRGNRAIAKKRRSPLVRILLLMLVSLVVVFYVWNKITVNALNVEVHDLGVRYQQLQSANDELRAEINKKASIERIGTAAARIGLIYPKQQPIWFDADTDLMGRFSDK